MARELSQEALLDFLRRAGGRVTNAALLSHFRRFLRDPGAPPGQLLRRRELFKGFVNSVAAVRQDPDGTKCVVLRRRFRDLLGEEGPPRAREPPAAPAEGAATCSPPGARGRRRRRREEEPEEGPAADAGRRGPPEAAGKDRARRRSPGPGPEPAGAVGAGVRGAAAEAQGGCRREGPPNGPPLLGATADPAAARAPPARPDRGAPPPRREDARAERAPAPAAPRTSPAAAEASESRPAPPALRPRPAPSGDPAEPRSPGSPPRARWQLQLQQRRTREWVARHPRGPGPPEQGPTRAWSVLPDNFPQPSSDPGFWGSESTSVVAEAPRSSHPAFPEVPGNPPHTIFRSIRCQLSLQDLDDFVDQESHDSDESSSDPKESPGGSEEGLHAVPGRPGWGRLRSPPGGLALSEEDSSRQSPRGSGNRGDGPNPPQGPAGLQGLDPWPRPAPKFRRSLGRSARAARTKSTSSDEERLDEEDTVRRSRRPPRSRKPSRAGVAPSPRLDAALTQRPTALKAAVAGQGQPRSFWVPSRERAAPHRPSLVPLDAREHEWIVKLASGSWMQVLALFREDPQLVLHRDFLSGYTALHWVAKHGALGALRDVVSGAQKAGITLDVNVKSSCGYTPLHLAAIHGHQGVIKLLVQRMASRVNVRDSSGKKPWQYLTSSASGETWQLLGAPRGRPIFPAFPLAQSSSPTRRAPSRERTRSVARKTSLAALLKHQQSKWKLAHQTLKEREEWSD